MAGVRGGGRGGVRAGGAGGATAGAALEASRGGEPWPHPSIWRFGGGSCLSASVSVTAGSAATAAAPPGGKSVRCCCGAAPCLLVSLPARKSFFHCLCLGGSGFAVRECRASARSRRRSFRDSRRVWGFATSQQVTRRVTRVARARSSAGVRVSSFCFLGRENEPHARISFLHLTFVHRNSTDATQKRLSHA